MSKRTNLRNIGLIVFQLATFLYYAWLRIDNARFIHEGRSFGDVKDYVRIASLPVFSKAFWTDIKPPLTSLVWKFVNSDPGRVFHLQLLISIPCWGILALAVSRVIRSYPLKPLAFAIVLAFSLSRDIYMWDPFLGSESLALSFTALFVACAIWLLLEWGWHKAFMFLIAGFLLVFTRDTYTYFLLMIAVIIFPLFWFTNYRWGVSVISVIFILLYFISSALATAGLRPYTVMMLVTSLRIFPSDEYTNYFRMHGMPIDDTLVEMSRNPQPGRKFAVNIALYYDKEQEDYRQWLREHGKTEFIKFLWFYKADTLQKVFLETPQQSFYPDVYYYTATGYRPILRDPRLREILYPTRFGLAYFFAANLFAAILASYAWLRKKALWLAPVLMILLTYPQAVLVWASDANDIARHSIPHNVLMRLGVWLLLFFLLDHLYPALYIWLSSFRRTRPEENG